MNKRFLTIAYTLAVGLTLLTISDVSAATPGIKRLWGDNRYQTCSAIVNDGWSSSQYAVIVNGENFPDALSASTLAKKFKAPILLTENNQLTSNTYEQLKRLNVKEVLIVGGEFVVKPEVESAINKLGIKVTRYKGADRAETSITVAKEIGTQNGIILTTGNDFTDALSIAPIAAKLQIPIILMPKDSVPDSVSNFIKGKNIPKTYVLGGQDLISDSVASKFPNVQRIEGRDKYERNINIINTFANEFNFDSACVAYSEKFADALSGSALAALNGNPIILVGDKPAAVTKNFISSKTLSNLNVLGGTAGVTQLTVDKLLGAEDTNIYSEYYKILQEKVSNYGTLKQNEKASRAEHVLFVENKGVAHAALIDFDGNGTEELFICYNTGGDKCTYEVWGYNGSAYLIMKQDVEIYGAGYEAWSYLEVYKQDKNSYVAVHLHDKMGFKAGDKYKHQYSYGTLVDGKWVRKDTELISTEKINNSGLPWDNSKRIILFDEYTYSSQDEKSLASLLEELKKYSK